MSFVRVLITSAGKYFKVNLHGTSAKRWERVLINPIRIIIDFSHRFFFFSFKCICMSQEERRSLAGALVVSFQCAIYKQANGVKRE